MNLPLLKKTAQVMAAASPTQTVLVKAGDRTIELSGDALVAVLDLVDKRGMTLGQVLAEAIAIQKAISDEQAKGYKVVFEQNGQAPRELVVA